MALSAVTAISMAPASTIPWMEWAADISGVCRVAGTLLITSKPTQRLSTKMVRSVSRAVDIDVTSGGRGGLGGSSRRRGQRGIYELAIGADQHARLQVIIAVDGQRAVLDQVLQQRADVPRVH